MQVAYCRTAVPETSSRFGELLSAPSKSTMKMVLLTAAVPESVM
jgi:hypothetical protein